MALHGWVTEAEADLYFTTRLNAAGVWVAGIKPAALQTAYEHLIGCGYFTFPDTATDEMKKMQYEQTLFHLLADPDYRLALQAQGVLKANVVGETYKDREQPNVAIAPLAWTIGEEEGYLDQKTAYINELSRTERTDTIVQ